jgi:hypothetical protein
MVITTPDSSLMGNQKCLIVNCGLFAVQVGTASFRRMVDMVIVTEWFIYGHIEGTGTLDLLDFKHPAPSALSQTLH